MPENTYVWPSVWGLGNKAVINNTAQGFVNNQIDDMERFGEQDGDAALEEHVHVDTQAGNAPGGSMTNVQGGSVSIGRNVTNTRLVLGTLVADSQVSFYVNGVLEATYTIPAGADMTQLMNQILGMAVWNASAGYPNFFRDDANDQMIVEGTKVYVPS
jgi:hypothetical protein